VTAWNDTFVVRVRVYRTGTDRERGFQGGRLPGSQSRQYATALRWDSPMGPGSSFLSDAARGARSFQLEVAAQMA
jgi:hypothetical protein